MFLEETNTQWDSIMVILMLQTGRTQKLWADRCVQESLTVFFTFRWVNTLESEMHCM